ncbi:unnamed protein product [Tilletia controversa]|uniref:Uncharacterized protein n=3 Tax=Tilletia TaxID=13289 RepID=A0A8X7MIZ6_9BASI|nr:hypothetical protein CF336_g8785 [Tilletia laevis]KAE8182760.1 hypothetical protein CF328_g8406 [Tilletia controversa]KAE8240729.1 hypothetical protein A4X03_0g8418 [Tilletia caries]KAE8184476.1 hypothetical protein CF335_g8011 [Tilletia laevis]KAE8237983.1 hypothetical protein A4X06_0g9038 [Tilletia controversa]
MDPIGSDSSSFTWSALNSNSESSGGGRNTGSGSGNDGDGSGSSNDMDILSNGAAPLQIMPAVVNTSVQATQPAIPIRPSGFITSVTTRTFALPTAAALPTSTSVLSSVTTRPPPPASSSGLSPAIMLSISSAVASAAAASSLSASLAAPSGRVGPLKNITSDATAADTSAPVPLRRNAPLILLLVLGCLVGAATIMASLAWLCRVTDSRKRAKKKARLNQASWDPDASSSVFDGASSSLDGGGSNLFGPTTAVDVMGTAAERGVGSNTSWWMLGENTKRTSSPSLMHYEDEKFDAERENSSGIFIDSLPADPVSIPPPAAIDSGRPRRGPSSRQHRRTGSMLSGLGMPPSAARPLPSLVVSSHHHGGAHEPPPGLVGSRMSMLYQNDYPIQNDPYTRLRTPGPGLFPAHGRNGDPSIARMGTPVLSPLLNQIMHSGPGAGPPILRPGTPSSLLAGRPGGRGPA